MSVHGINSTAKGKTQETGDWNVKTNVGKAVLDSKHKPLTGLSFGAARAAARGHFTRTGEWVHEVRG